MSNLPLGAEYDPCAPFNINEDTFVFDFGVKGKAWYEYCGDLDLDEARECIKQRLVEALSQLGDIEVGRVDFSMY